MNRKVFWPDSKEWLQIFVIFVVFIFGLPITLIAFKQVPLYLMNMSLFGAVVVFFAMFYSTRIIIDEHSITGPIQAGMLGWQKFPKSESEIIESSQENIKLITIRHKLSRKQITIPAWIFSSKTLEGLRRNL